MIRDNRPGEDRRLVRVAVPPHWLRDIVIQGAEMHVRCIEGAPMGARIVGMYNDIQGYTTWLMLEHPGFEPVPLGQQVPELSVVLQDIGVQVADLQRHLTETVQDLKRSREDGIRLCQERDALRKGAE